MAGFSREVILYRGRFSARATEISRYSPALSLLKSLTNGPTRVNRSALVLGEKYPDLENWQCSDGQTVLLTEQRIEFA